MTQVIPKAELFARLGFAGDAQLFEQALAEAGLSRPEKQNISVDKAAAVREVLASRFIPVCTRGDCQAEVASVVDGRSVVPAAVAEECGVCGGSANARAVKEMVEVIRASGMKRLCVVGGSVATRAELERLVAGGLELRLVDGTDHRKSRQASADLAWADRVAIWGGTVLAHRVSNLYRGEHVIHLARRSIQELAREVTRSVRRTP